MVLDEKYIINVLSNRKDILETVQTKKSMWQEDSMELDAELATLTRQLASLYNSNKDSSQDNIISILKGNQERISEQRQEVVESLNALNEEEQRIKKIWSAFLALTGDDFKILNDMYVMDLKWDFLCLEYGIGRTALHNRRRIAIDKLRKVSGRVA